MWIFKVISYSVCYNLAVRSWIDVKCKIKYLVTFTCRCYFFIIYDVTLHGYWLLISKKHVIDRFVWCIVLLYPSLLSVNVVNLTSN